MKKILLIISSAFVFRLFLIAGFSAPPRDNPGSYEDSAKIAKGEATFNQYCIGCHNFRQDGIGPQLGGLTAKVAASSIAFRLSSMASCRFALSV
jgi:cytochrome c2